MRHSLTLVALVLVACAPGTNHKRRAALTLPPEQVSCTAPSAVPTSELAPQWGEALRLTRETNDVLEDCVMPAYGLYPRRRVCDAPPTDCR